MQSLPIGSSVPCEMVRATHRPPSRASPECVTSHAGVRKDMLVTTNLDLAEAQIAVHWKEEERIPPPDSFVAQANLTDPGVDRRFALENFPDCFAEYAEMLTWSKRWDKVLDDATPPFWKWFVGGTLNASVNCIDRHLPASAERAAFVFVPELESEPIETITYQDLYDRVNEVAAVLRDVCGVRRGDRVTIHLPLVPARPISMLACARIGAIHSVVFSGHACGQAIADSGSRVLITIEDHLAQAQDIKVDKGLVWRGRATPQGPPRAVDPVAMPAEAPLFLVYTSGTTGAPKACQHSTGGYLAYVTGTAKYILDIKSNDVYWCTADIAWIAGHSCVVYAPLALGATSVIYEGMATYPDAGRMWRIAERLGVGIFHTASTLLRTLRRRGPDEPAKSHHRFRLIATFGDAIEPEVWRWVYERVGRKEAVLVDTWWQTESGGILCATKPALQPMKPGSSGPGAPGIHPVIFDEEGNVPPPGKAGNICIRNPWPGMMQTIWRGRPYFSGDGAVCAGDGYFRIVGRVDDVINVAGHRLGTKELESACLAVSDVAEAAVVSVADDARGRVPDVYVALKPGVAPSAAVERAVAERLETLIGKIARPRHVHIVPDMPKTRSGKIMRRILAAISNEAPVGDTSTLANPEVVEQIQEMVHVDV